MRTWISTACVAVAALCLAGPGVTVPVGAQVKDKLKEAGEAAKQAGKEAGKAGKAVGEATAEGAKDVAGKTKDVTVGTGKAVGSGAKAAAVGTKEAVAGVPDNTLSAAETTDGWKLLFDGKSLAGWRGYRQTTAEGWKVVDGAISGGVEGGDLVSADAYANFELKVDFNVAPKGNSGIFYRGVESEKGPIYWSAPEYQVLDNGGHPDAKNGPDRFCGANYSLDPPTKDVCKPGGQWNSAHIIVNGAHVEHWLNGEKVVEYELWSPAWQQKVAGSKFKQWPEYGMAKSGLIGLQNHGNAVEFKNIKIKVLKSGTNE